MSQKLFQEIASPPVKHSERRSSEDTRSDVLGRSGGQLERKREAECTMRSELVIFIQYFQTTIDPTCQWLHTIITMILCTSSNNTS